MNELKKDTGMLFLITDYEPEMETKTAKVARREETAEVARREETADYEPELRKRETKVVNLVTGIVCSVGSGIMCIVVLVSMAIALPHANTTTLVGRLYLDIIMQGLLALSVNALAIYMAYEQIEIWKNRKR